MTYSLSHTVFCYYIIFMNYKPSRYNNSIVFLGFQIKNWSLKKLKIFFWNIIPQENNFKSYKVQVKQNCLFDKYIDDGWTNCFWNYTKFYQLEISKRYFLIKIILIMHYWSIQLIFKSNFLLGSPVSAKIIVI